MVWVSTLIPGKWDPLKAPMVMFIFTKLHKCGKQACNVAELYIIALSTMRATS